MIYRNIYNNIFPEEEEKDRMYVFNPQPEHPMNQTVNIKQRGLVFTRNPSELASRTDSHVCID